MRLESKPRVSARLISKRHKVKRASRLHEGDTWPDFMNPTLALNPIAHSHVIRTINLSVAATGWDMNDRSLVMVMTQGIGSHLTNDEKRAHLIDLKRDHLIDKVCIQEILPPDKT
jgi:hypothetical protein